MINRGYFFKKIWIFFLIINLDIILFEIDKNERFIFCHNCVGKKDWGPDCFNCSTDILFKSIRIMTIEQTLQEIINNKKSIARYGDGEFRIIFGKSIKFQRFNQTLKEKLLNVLNSNFKNLLVGIVQLYNNTNPFWINFIENNKFQLAKIINKHKIYSNSYITRFYDPKGDKTRIKNYIINFKKLWNNRNILIIEGEKTRLGIGNDLFNNTKSIKRIICPEENAFDSYGKIIEYIKSLKLDKNTLILISLGPTATVLTYDIFKLGNQIIDFGHFDIQYEYFLRNASKKIKIPNKYVMEVPGGSINITIINDQKYYEQIIHKIYR